MGKIVLFSKKNWGGNACLEVGASSCCGLHSGDETGWTGGFFLSCSTKNFRPRFLHFTWLHSPLRQDFLLGWSTSCLGGSGKVKNYVWGLGYAWKCCVSCVSCFKLHWVILSEHFDTAAYDKGDEWKGKKVVPTTDQLWSILTSRTPVGAEVE